MSDQLGVILDFLMRPGVDYNLQKQKYWGVLFYKKPNNTISAIVASAFFVIEMENVKVDVKGEFFYYRENKWGESPYPRSTEDILRVFNITQMGGIISSPLPNLLNFIGRISEDYRKKSRIIISPNNLNREHIILKFVKDSNGNIIARNPAIQKPFVPLNPLIYRDFGTRNQFYSCRIIHEESHKIMVEVIDIYGLLRLGIKISPNGYIPDDTNRINSLVDMPIEFKYGIYQMSPQTFLPYPTHVDCTMFYDLLRTLAIVNAKVVDISIGNDPNFPIIIRNRKESLSDPQINIYMTTLNQTFGAQRR